MRKRRKQIKTGSYRKKKRNAPGLFVCYLLLLVCAILVGGIFLLEHAPGSFMLDHLLDPQKRELLRRNDSEKPQILEEFLTINPYSRPGERLSRAENIFIHYTANPETSARQNRSYFENLRMTQERSASAHFIIGTEGEIIQCIPLNEIAYAVKTRNYDSISIECCYLAADGQFTDATYKSLLKLTGWLMKKYRLLPDDVLRHYDSGGKKCPLYYVENEDSWNQFRQDLTDYMQRK